MLKPAYVAQVAALCRAHGLVLHVDGARIMNAAVALKATPASLVRPRCYATLRAGDACALHMNSVSRHC